MYFKRLHLCISLNIISYSSWWQYCCRWASEEEAESHMTSVFVPVILISVSVCESQSTDGSAAAQHTLFTQVNASHTLCTQLRYTNGPCI